MITFLLKIFQIPYQQIWPDNLPLVHSLSKAPLHICTTTSLTYHGPLFTLHTFGGWTTEFQ